MVYNKNSGFVKGYGNGREKTRKIVESVQGSCDRTGDPDGAWHFRAGAFVLSVFALPLKDGSSGDMDAPC